MKTGLKLLCITGIIGIAVFAGTLQALAAPRKTVKKEGEQEQGKSEKV